MTFSFQAAKKNKKYSKIYSWRIRQWNSVAADSSYNLGIISIYILPNKTWTLELYIFTFKSTVYTICMYTSVFATYFSASALTYFQQMNRSRPLTRKLLLIQIRKDYNSRRRHDCRILSRMMCNWVYSCFGYILWFQSNSTELLRLWFIKLIYIFFIEWEILSCLLT